MRKSMVIALSLVFVVASASAQQPNRSNSVSVFVSDLSVIESSSSGTNVDAAYGVAFDHMFNKRFSAELSVMSRKIHESSAIITANGPVFSYYSNTVYPVDANVSYHFFTNSRWKPYLGGGLRYVDDSRRGFNAFSSRGVRSMSVNPEVSGGVTFQFRPTLGLRFDVKQTINGNDSVPGDSSLNASVGLSFRF
jgi:outer membrane protein W